MKANMNVVAKTLMVIKLPTLMPPERYFFGQSIPRPVDNYGRLVLEKDGRKRRLID